MLLLFFMLPGRTYSAGLSVTPYLGYRTGGEFEDGISGDRIKLAEEESYGLISSKDTGDLEQVASIYSIQPTKFVGSGVLPYRIR